jgi:hypothetical protein
MIGVSKRCCPVCSCILVELSRHNQSRPLRVLGVHGSIYPCTIPPGLPATVTEAVVSALEGMLSAALYDVYHLDKHRGRRDSISSTESHPFETQRDPVLILPNKPKLEYLYIDDGVE